MPSPRKRSKSKPLSLKSKLLETRVLKVKNLTANAGDPKRICTFELMLESPMGPECGGAIQFDVAAKVKKIGPGSGK